MSQLSVYSLGLVDYRAAWELQRTLAAAVRDGVASDCLLLVQHPHVYTLGRGADRSHLLSDEAALADLDATVIAIDRGGDVTYHGPGQLVGYPIVDLRRRGRDVHAYVRALEEGLIDAAAQLGVSAARRPGLPGVWVDEAKLASIGVAVRRWVTTHGFALNAGPDLSYFDHIVPCGIRGKGVTSLSQLLQRPVTVAEVAPSVANGMANALGMAPVAGDCEQLWEQVGIKPASVGDPAGMAAGAAGADR